MKLFLLWLCYRRGGKASAFRTQGFVNVNEHILFFNQDNDKKYITFKSKIYDLSLCNKKCSSLNATTADACSSVRTSQAFA